MPQAASIEITTNKPSDISLTASALLPIPTPEVRLPTAAFLRKPYRKVTRPSTAPAHEDVVLLPSGNPTPSLLSSHQTGSAPCDTRLPALDGVAEPSTILLTRDDSDIPIGCPSHLSRGLSSSPTVLVISSQDPSSSDTRSNNETIDLDWPTFIHAYAHGRWDPHQTPKRPKSLPQFIELVADPVPKCSDKTEVKRASESINVIPSPLLTEPTVEVTTSEAPPALHQPKSVTIGNPFSQEVQPSKPTYLNFHIPSPLKFRGLRPTLPLNLPPPSHRLRNSFSTVPPSGDNIYGGTPATNAELQTTVATMRWAASRVDISPLALPSPEHELADPMRGVTAAIPGAHPLNLHPDYPMTPGGTRRSRLTEFWEGTIDIEEKNMLRRGSCNELRKESKENEKPQLVQTAAPPPSLNKRNSQPSLAEKQSHNNIRPVAPPATAPSRDAYHASDLSQNDYFGDIDIQSSAVAAASKSPPSQTKDDDDTLLIPVIKLPSLSVDTRELTNLPELGTVSVPAVPKRYCLTRQISSPLPAALPAKDTRVFGGRMMSEVTLKGSRPSKEEQQFEELKYLAPPEPPNETERRRALHKYNIWNTGPDMNFDRIAHLAKLVFSTKGVIISLIDGIEVWHKSEWGLQITDNMRSVSFCGHTILQRGDEPMVILDADADWRFKHSPLVVDGPNIKFYAGAPLRTQDGFNVGALAIMDDEPREEFSPRLRHILKEFAAIVMREMELWRDKIQLRVRDRIQTSMEHFSRECLEIDEETHTKENPDSIVGTSMDKVYDRAAKLVKRTLDVEGVIVMDVSHCEVLETMNAEANVALTMHYGDMEKSQKKDLKTEEYRDLIEFFSKWPEGKISEGIVPSCFRPFLPTHIQYALTVPIYNIDKQLFALICAYNASDYTKRYLEGHELSYLRAIGVIILSAVLKRRMILADKAKSLFISNISHELRTPLHGILAAAELLSETQLHPSQKSYLQTVQACGTSLVETVNHVLDFTKLSGNAKFGGVEHVIIPSKVDLLQLVEEAVDGCWVGHRARTAIMGDSGIGSVYSPPKEEDGEVVARQHVETVIDIGYRAQGWTLKCEKGGIRRVLMNLFGNSLKFTSDGYISVLLHQLPRLEDDPPNKVRVELVVVDTGKGISRNFLKNQLFHPFSQENPLQTGTGLGLAIVSSIVTSDVVGGKVDVWSQETVGTEIKVTFNAEAVEIDDGLRYGENATKNMEPIKIGDRPRPSISLVGFDEEHRGIVLLRKVTRSYLENWWKFEVTDDPDAGDIVIINEDVNMVLEATEERDISRPFIVFSSARGSPSVMQVANEHERIGGFCRTLYKPGGPARLREILELAVHYTTIGPLQLDSGDSFDPRIHTILRRRSEGSSQGFDSSSGRPGMAPRSNSAYPVLASSLPSMLEVAEERNEVIESPHASKFNSLFTKKNEVKVTTKDEETTRPTPCADGAQKMPPSTLRIERPRLETAPSTTSKEQILNTDSDPMSPPISVTESECNPSEDTDCDGFVSVNGTDRPVIVDSEIMSSVIPFGESGTLLKSSLKPWPTDEGCGERTFRILVVEDNGILRNLLTKWLANKGYEFRHAVDGQAGVMTYAAEGPFDVVLLDLSMPVLDGVSATIKIREYERENPIRRQARILALTGMSAIEDKRRAFEAGVDGYLVKPVAFKILDEMFNKMGVFAPPSPEE